MRVRDALLAAPVDVGPDSGEVVLAELLALRSLFLNLQFRADKAPLTEAELRGQHGGWPTQAASACVGTLNYWWSASMVSPSWSLVL